MVFVAFILSLIVFLAPTYADLMFSALRFRDFGAAIIIMAACLLVVLVPLFLSSILTRRNPTRWVRSKLATATWVIIGISIGFTALFWFNVATKTKTENNVPEDIVANAPNPQD